MRRLVLVPAIAGAAFLALSAPLSAQTSNNSGWGGALEQLNRAVNPDSQPQSREREVERDAERDGRRYEGSSEDRRDTAGPYRRYSDRDLRDQYDRLTDEQRQMQRNRRAMEDEMERRGLRR